MIQRPSAKPSKGSGIYTSIFLFLFSLPFAGFGTVAVYKGIGKLFNGQIKEGMILTFLGTIFALIGFGFLVVVFFGSRMQKRESAIKLAHPDEPWLWRKDWAHGRVVSSNKSVMTGAWVFAGIWNLVSSSVFLAFAEKQRHDHAIYIALIFPVIGVGLLIWAIRATIRWKKFGQSIFTLLPFPGVIGGQVSGAIETSVKLKPEDGFHLKLLCINRITTSSGDSSSTTERVLWEDERTLLKELLDNDPRRSGIPVFFQIPSGVRESDDSNSHDRIVWRLEARAKIPGIDYFAQFEVPVFQTGNSDTAPAPINDPTLAYQAPTKPYELPANSRITVRILPDGAKEFYFPAARNMSVITFLSVFIAIWTAAIGFGIKFHAPIFFPIVFGFFEVFLLIFLFNALLKSSRIIADAARIEIMTSWFFFRSRKNILASDILALDTSIGMTNGQNVYYDLRVRTRSRSQDMKMATAVRDRKLADWLIAEMERVLKLDNTAGTPSIGQ